MDSSKSVELVELRIVHNWVIYFWMRCSVFRNWICTIRFWKMFFNYGQLGITFKFGFYGSSKYT